MATFQKRKNKDGSLTYRAIIRRKGAPPVTKSFPSKAAAAAWAGRTESEILAGERGEIPNQTFGDLLERYNRDVSPAKRGARWEGVRINLLLRDPVAQVKLKDLDSRAVAGWRDRRLETVSAASVRREWNLLSAACNIAVREWRYLRVNPFAGVKRPTQPEHRNRLATDAELDAVAAVVNSPVQAKVVLAARFAVETGMRAGEIIRLTPDRVDTERRVARLEQTKNGTRREVPLSPAALKIWEESGDGFGMSDAARDVHWRNLCTKAGVTGLHFHDMRHTAITRLAKKLQVLDLARMVGIRDLKVLMVYYNESAADIALKL